MSQERTCKNCLYYLREISVIANRICDIGGSCINYNPYSPFKVNPHDMKNCPIWESKEKGGNKLPF